MKHVIPAFTAVMLSLFSAPKASAVAQIDYICGEYTVELFGPDKTTVYNSKGEEVLSTSVEELSPLITKKDGKTVLRLIDSEVDCQIKK